MFSPIFSFSFAHNFAVPMADDSPSPDHQPCPIPATQTAITDVPVTILRPVFNPDPTTNTCLPNPGTARANVAATPECPAGTPGWAAAHAHATVLQQHCAFFDADGDGVV
uniref:Alcohol oxidase n=1 Tax=Ganoderma boninense TaxID=34458 RepID=A0A5K1JVE4_9APHY|nr:Alcohol oxidase [Ganoderma boninense]